MFVMPSEERWRHFRPSDVKEASSADLKELLDEFVAVRDKVQSQIKQHDRLVEKCPDAANPSWKRKALAVRKSTRLCIKAISTEIAWRMKEARHDRHLAELDAARAAKVAKKEQRQLETALIGAAKAKQKLREKAARAMRVERHFVDICKETMPTEWFDGVIADALERVKRLQEEAENA